MAARRLIFDIMHQQHNRNQIPKRGILNPANPLMGANCFLHTGVLSCVMDQIVFDTVTGMQPEDLPANDPNMPNRLLAFQDVLMQMHNASQVPLAAAQPTNINNMVAEFLMNQNPPNDGGQPMDFFNCLRRGLDVPAVNRCGSF